jgi:hypothetical protein
MGANVTQLYNVHNVVAIFDDNIELFIVYELLGSDRFSVACSHIVDNEIIMSSQYDQIHLMHLDIVAGRDLSKELDWQGSINDAIQCHRRDFWGHDNS